VTARRARDERGETLLELLITITIMGILFVAVLMGVATAISSSTSQRHQANAEVAVRAYAERVIDSNDLAYVNCATPASYASPAGFAPPADYTATITSIKYWNGANNPPIFASPGACPTTDNGLQQITVTLQSPAGKDQATESAVIVKRR